MKNSSEDSDETHPVVKWLTPNNIEGIKTSRQKLAIWLLSRGIVSLKLKPIKQARITKCTESMWKLTYYAGVQLFIFSISYQEPWFGDRKELFKGWPNQPLKFPLKLFYMCQCGFYTYSIGALLIWETRRKDFTIMMSHHVITVFLIAYSFFTRFFRCGSIVLALHDTSDVFMETAKLFKYCGKEMAASMCFGLFAISWLLLRLIYFPFWIIRSSSYDLIQYLALPDPYHIWMYYVFNTMLLTLLMFHIYWWILISLMVLRQLKNKGQVGEDIRSDSEDGE
ncbi:ceramide synthase LOH2 isoform X2 [Cryptomeria japonica]|uniref:ceramide synthase LOH2 isoform X2 n=1 Tax=Cryptomeria japonica TaxID=3369 RepID=UPI0025ACC0AE|nr:ceramide synthase LOH2 isoform X2 [Cryptomeria japonica]